MVKNGSKQSPQRLRLIPHLERATHAVAVYLQANPGVRCTQPEANVLAFLHGRGKTSLSEIHASFGHRRSTLTSVISRLEDRKMLVRERDPGDGRAFLVSLTRGGSALAQDIVAYLEILESQASRRLTKSELHAFVNVADALAQAARAH